MSIENRQIRIPRSRLNTAPLRQVVEEAVGPNALRWYVTRFTDDEVVAEVTLYPGGVRPPEEGRERRVRPGRSAVVSIVPTGVGCSVGGFAGDAAPATSLLAATADYLITNPNAVNASDFIGLAPNVLYAEGFCIDLFCQGLTDLYIPYGNKVGLIVEAAEPAALDQIFNVVNTVRAVHGVDVLEPLVTDRPIGSHCVENLSGAFVGTVDNPDVLLAACDQLLARGANALAITTAIQDLPPEEYIRHYAGDYPNPLGGVEAVISHLVVNHFGVPAAHAPLLNDKNLPLLDPVVDARAAGEMTSASGLACVLVGLRQAPQLHAERGRVRDAVNVHNLLAVVAPASSLGGIPTLHARERGIPVIAVAENETILSVGVDEIGAGGIVPAHSYAEAAGLLLALRQGIALDTLARPLTTYRHAGRRGGEVVAVGEEWSDQKVAG